MYLESLLLRLAAGAMQLPDEQRACHAAFLVAAQQADGGFAGRRGASDCYYTSFGLRALAILGALDEPIAQRAAGFLRDALARTLPPVDFLSLVGSAQLLEAMHGLAVFAPTGIDRRKAVEQLAATLWRGDGYAKTPRSGPSSTYQTFLVALAVRSVGGDVPDASAVAQAIQSRQQPDGGFSELAVLSQSGTNPTAAAVGLLTAMQRLSPAIADGAARYLGDMQTSEGGLRANARAPAADLLSTFTALVATGDLESVQAVDIEAVDIEAIRRFVASLQQPLGGFRAGTWDNIADVEYTFYGLGATALAQSTRQS